MTTRAEAIEAALREALDELCDFGESPAYHSGIEALALPPDPPCQECAATENAKLREALEAWMEFADR